MVFNCDDEGEAEVFIATDYTIGGSEATSHWSGQIMFDAISRLCLKMQKTNVGISATGARILWGLDHPRELDQWTPRIKLVTKLSVMDPDYPNVRKMSGGLRLILRSLALIPALRDMGLMLRHRF